MTDDERRKLDAVVVDLEGEEADQLAERGCASPKLVRAIARLERLTSADLPDERGDGGVIDCAAPSPGVAAVCQVRDCHRNVIGAGSSVVGRPMILMTLGGSRVATCSSS